MYGGDLVIIERPGKPYLAAHAGMIWMQLLLQVDDKSLIPGIAENFYNQYGTGKDPNEFELESLENLRDDPKCGADVHIIIPKTKDRFLKVSDFLAGDLSCKISPKIDERLERMEKNRENKQEE